jgi:hypothetical protein
VSLPPEGSKACVNPHFSVILLTTLIGAGQGLFVAVFAAELCALFGLLPPPDVLWFYFQARCSRSGSRLRAGGVDLSSRPPFARMAVGRRVAHVVAVA